MGGAWDRATPAVAALCVAIAACDAGSGALDAGPIPMGGFGRRDAGSPTDPPPPPPPPEMEVEVRFEPPAVGATVLYATNRDAGRVAIIHADDFSIETVRVGPSPEPAIAAPGRDVALSLQRLDGTVSVLHTEGATTTVTTLAMEHDANAVAFDPTGRFAVLFEAPRPDVVRRNFHDVSVVDLEDPTTPVTRWVVGYGPSRVAFEPTGARAFVVNEDGVSILELGASSGGSMRAPLLTFDSLVPIVEAHVTRDGRYAVALVEGDSLRQLDLADGTLTIADLSVIAEDGLVVISDVDLSPTGDEVLVVVRSHEVIARLPLGPTLADAAGWTAMRLEGHAIGALAFAETGTRVVGYTTDPAVETVTVLDLAEGVFRRVPLRKSVRALAVAPDGSFALALHHVRATEAPGEEGSVDLSPGYSVIDLSTGFARLALVDAAPAPDGAVLDVESGHLILALRDDDAGVRELQLVDLASFAVDRVPLVAPPTTVGVFPALDRAFIGQEADGGRVTFYTWGSRETHTVAGFELAARVRR